MLLVYSIIDEQSFTEMGRWLTELKENLGDDIIVHVVGTKSDVVAQDPNLRRVPFERCIHYVAEHLHPEQKVSPPNSTSSASMFQGLDSKRSSGFWGQDIGWDCCHEISAKDGEGIDEVFRVLTRKLVEQKNKMGEQGQVLGARTTPATERGNYFDVPGLDGQGSFRVGHGDKRRSWLGLPAPSFGMGEEGSTGVESDTKGKRGKCC